MEEGTIVHVEYDLYNAESGDLIETTREDVAKEHDMHQEGSGSHYAHIYWYGNTDDSESTMTQKGDASHNAQIIITGSEHTIFNLLQQGNTNQSYFQ